MEGQKAARSCELNKKSLRATAQQQAVVQLRCTAAPPPPPPPPPPPHLAVHEACTSRPRRQRSQQLQVQAGRRARSFRRVFYQRFTSACPQPAITRHICPPHGSMLHTAHNACQHIQNEAQQPMNTCMHARKVEGECSRMDD